MIQPVFSKSLACTGPGTQPLAKGTEGRVGRGDEERGQEGGKEREGGGREGSVEKSRGGKRMGKSIVFESLLSLRQPGIT